MLEELQIKNIKPLNYQIIEFESFGDQRGDLVALEAFKNIPFAINRVYYIFSTGKNVRRGLHAHLTLKQVAIVVRGSCRFLLDNGFEKQEIVMDSPKKGLLIEGTVWREMYNFSEDCVLMVLADQHYDESDYIRDYDQFLEVAQKGHRA